jgi:hypothetical protein
MHSFYEHSSFNSMHVQGAVSSKANIKSQNALFQMNRALVRSKRMMNQTMFDAPEPLDVHVLAAVLLTHDSRHSGSGVMLR